MSKFTLAFTDKHWEFIANAINEYLLLAPGVTGTEKRQLQTVLRKIANAQK